MPKPALTWRFVEDTVCPAGKKERTHFRRRSARFRAARDRERQQDFPGGTLGSAGKRRIKIGPFGALTVRMPGPAPEQFLERWRKGATPLARNGRQQLKRWRPKPRHRRRQRLMRSRSASWSKLWEKARAEKRRPSYLRSVTDRSARHLKDWLDRPAASITQAEARDRIEEIATRAPIAANRTLSYARAAFGWAQARGKLPSNPFTRH